MEKIASIGVPPQTIQVHVQQFEKDDDTNHHVDFITQASNLRATAYKIKVADRMETKRIAGRIIPAIATTTACVAGLASLELMKVMMSPKHRELKIFKNTFLNLGLPFFSMSEPAEAKKMPIVGTNATFTVWDSWEMKSPNVTLEEFITHFKNRFGLIVNGIFKEVNTLYMEAVVSTQSTGRFRRPKTFRRGMDTNKVRRGFERCRSTYF
eukprot:TRINITY_DN4728_c0_g1_i4.p1 TRINITY_DN4728_c0_g1~~TRINITY_DN4728_c0_g1_i4.p1  ORF type:complete len:210 (+),score=54.73 TRINITY_DN4728_c0_g1_i4:24-653(+)